MAEIVILGAGLTGLSAAYHLEQTGFFDYKLFEKEPVVGGLCRSLQQDGFTFDYTGHLLHISDDYFQTLIQKTIGFDQLNQINRRSFIYSHDRYTHYPYQINLHGLPAEVITECITDFVNRPHYDNATTFKEWVLHNFGAGLGKHFFYPFQGKIFDFPLEKLSSSWTGRFVPQTSLNQMLMGALQNPNQKTTQQSNQAVGYNAQFFYPKQGGISTWLNKLAHLITNKIQTEQTVTSIDMTNKQVIFANGHTEPYKKLITTLPLTTLIKLLKEPSSSSLKQALPHLLCNSVTCVNLGLNRPDISDKHWIYVPEKQHPFYRIGFWHNFAQSMVPKDCSSLYAEFSHLNQPQKIITDRLHNTRKKLKQILNFDSTDIATEQITTIEHAYVIFDQWRDAHLPTLLKQLEQQNIYSVGRYGAWKYSSMQEGVLDGKAIAEQLSNNYLPQVHNETFLQKS